MNSSLKKYAIFIAVYEAETNKTRLLLIQVNECCRKNMSPNIGENEKIMSQIYFKSRTTILEKINHTEKDIIKEKEQ